MSKYQKIVVALLGAIAIEGAVTAERVRRIARDGFNMELTIEQADTLAQRVSEAKEAALEDMRESE